MSALAPIVLPPHGSYTYLPPTSPFGLRGGGEEVAWALTHSWPKSEAYQLIRQLSKASSIFAAYNCLEKLRNLVASHDGSDGSDDPNGQVLNFLLKSQICSLSTFAPPINPLRQRFIAHAFGQIGALTHEHDLALLVRFAQLAVGYIDAQRFELPHIGFQEGPVYIDFPAPPFGTFKRANDTSGKLADVWGLAASLPHSIVYEAILELSRLQLPNSPNSPSAYEAEVRRILMDLNAPRTLALIGTNSADCEVLDFLSRTTLTSPNNHKEAHTMLGYLIRPDCAHIPPELTIHLSLMTVHYFKSCQLKLEKAQGRGIRADWMPG